MHFINNIDDRRGLRKTIECLLTLMREHQQVNDDYDDFVVLLARAIDTNIIIIIIMIEKESLRLGLDLTCDYFQPQPSAFTGFKTA